MKQDSPAEIYELHGLSMKNENGGVDDVGVNQSHITYAKLIVVIQLR